MEPTASGGGAAAGGGLMGIIQLAVIVLIIVSMWKIFAKAGKPGWAAIVPIYNIVVMLQIARKPGWWVLLMFIPIVNLVVGIMAMIALGKNFGKGTGFVVGMILLPFIFYPMLAFGDAQYQPVAPAS